MHTLCVREITEADQKYSAIISAPPPLCILNFVLGPFVLGSKSVYVNQLVLYFYFLPVFLLSFIVFISFSLLLIPFAYIKIIGHKFALMVMNKRLNASKCDLGLNACIFAISGLLILVLDLVRDCINFVRQAFTTDLDKRTHNQNQYLHVDQKTGEITKFVNRRVFKQLIRYFSKQNEKIVPYQSVASDVRREVGVQEGLNVLIRGFKLKVKEDTVLSNFYSAYDTELAKRRDSLLKAGKTKKVEMLPGTKVPIVLKEFSLLKSILLQNSMFIDLSQFGSFENKGKKEVFLRKQLQFDKKLFYQMLVDLERLRKVLNVKKQMFIFHTLYEGKGKDHNEWREKVNIRISQTLKYLNSQRILKIIDYDPVKHLKKG